jgi:hypothetical protein
LSAVLQPQFYPQRLPLHIGTWFNSAPIWFPVNAGTSLSTAAWPANNRALYVPVYLQNRFTVARFVVLNGSNATGSVDVGLYGSSGTKLISTGTTARAVTNVAQYIDVTDQSFPPGAYYLALVGSSTTGQYMRTTAASNCFVQAGGYLLEDLGSTVLPSSMTPSAYVSSVAFHWGFTQSNTL